MLNKELLTLVKKPTIDVLLKLAKKTNLTGREFKDIQAQLSNKKILGMKEDIITRAEYHKFRFFETHDQWHFFDLVYLDHEDLYYLWQLVDNDLEHKERAMLYIFETFLFTPEENEYTYLLFEILYTLPYEVLENMVVPDEYSYTFDPKYYSFVLKRRILANLKGTKKINKEFDEHKQYIQKGLSQFNFLKRLKK